MRIWRVMVDGQLAKIDFLVRVLMRMMKIINSL